jgi:hypothetical protein
MLRDIVALTSITPMTLVEIQDAMLSLKGLSRGKVSDMVNELTRPGYVRVASWNIDGGVHLGYQSSPKGVVFWIKNPENIPASLALVAQTISYVPESKAIE